MGWLDRLLGRTARVATRSPAESGFTPTTGSPVELPSATPVSALRGGYAVVDVETTGLSPRRDRVVSVAVVLVDSRGRLEHEWETLVNPQGPVGATHIHGIRDIDVVHAPTFDSLASPLVGLLKGRALVGHNVSFDAAFLKSEFGRAGWGWPSVPTLCTLKESFHFLPHLDRRRLADCCSECGIQIDGAHTALGDARATARLLAKYLDPHAGIHPLSEHHTILSAAAGVAWPAHPGGGRLHDPVAPRRELTPRARRVIARAPHRPTSLLESFTLADALDDGAPSGALAYLETLVEVLEDGQVDDDEQAALADVVELYELTAETVRAAHRGLVRALAREALEDGTLARAEKAELEHIARLLNVPDSEVRDLLNGEEEARLVTLSEGLRPLPDDWPLGDALCVGYRVVFTGCDPDERDRLETRASLAGVRIVGSVSRRTSMLVTDGSLSGTKAAAAEQLGVRRVHPHEFAILLDHLQPWTPTQSKSRSAAAPRPSLADHDGSAGPSASRELGAQVDVEDALGGGRRLRATPPSVVRAWARDLGLDVGVRGRISEELWQAYELAHAE